MSTTYRGSVQTNDHRNRYMLAPSIRRVAKRGSKAAQSEAYAAFEALLRSHTPLVGAHAYFEVVDSHGYTTTRVVFSGRPSAWRSTRGGGAEVVGGVWFLESGPEGLTDRIEAGTQAGEEKWAHLARHVQGGGA